MADDKGLTLTSFGEYLYSHVILFAPSVQGNSIYLIIYQIQFIEYICD